MTLEELYAIKRYFLQEYNYEARLGQQDVRDYKTAREAVEREIALKTMDPRKDKENAG
jgi:hypothetical protein